MPIYEYRCDDCGRRFEELVFSETRVVCPGCRTESVTRQLSVPAPPAHARATATSAPACEAGLPPGGGCCGGGACHQH